MSNAAYNNRSFVSDDGKWSEKEACKPSKPYSIELAEKSEKADCQIADEYEPYAHRKVEHPLSNNETIVHLLKSALGTGIFAMPNAFNHAGFIVGLIGTAIIGSIAVYCVHMLINAHYILCKRKKVASMTYPLVAEAALLSGPKCLHKFAHHMPNIVNSFLFMYQIGACCIYVVFIASNIKELADYFLDSETDVRMFMLIILLPLVFINWIRNLKYLAPLSTIANGVTIASFGIICYYIFREPISFEGRRATATLAEFPMFFGTVLFALEAIGVIMPLENEMKTPQSFGGPIGVLNRAMTLVVSLYIGLGFFGYLKYGSNTLGSITLNLPQNELVAQAAKAMLAFGVFITHAVACYVAIDIAWNQYLTNKIGENNPRKILWEYVLRTFLVLLTFALAIAIPNLELFISLIGALCLASAGLAIPAIIDFCTHWNTTFGTAKALMVLKNIFVLCMGLAGFIIGTSMSVKDIVETYFV